MHEAIRTSAMDPRTGKIDMGLFNTGTGTGKLREDMRKEVLNVLDAEAKGKAIKWSDLIKILGEQSHNVEVDPLWGYQGTRNEGVVKVVGERDKRMIRRLDRWLSVVVVLLLVFYSIALASCKHTAVLYFRSGSIYLSCKPDVYTTM